MRDPGAGAPSLAPDSQVRVRLIKMTHPDVEYDAVVIGDDGVHIVVRGPWAEAETRDLGFVRFEPGDVFTEHYWRDRWYSIKEVRDPGGVLKGWYCDVTRPVRVEGGLLVSEDLELDLWVSADGRTVLRLDEDEFAASGLTATDPVSRPRLLTLSPSSNGWDAAASSASASRHLWLAVRPSEFSSSMRRTASCSFASGTAVGRGGARPAAGSSPARRTRRQRGARSARSSEATR